MATPMQHKWFPALLPLAVIACDTSTSDDPDPTPIVEPGTQLTFESGSRLRARVLDGGDGAKAFVAWHDTELGADCTFRRGLDDAMYCMPEGLRVSYADERCMEPIVFRTECSPEDAVYAANPITDDCGAPEDRQWQVYEAGAPLGQTTQRWWRNHAGVCVPVQSGERVEAYAAMPVFYDDLVRGDLGWANDITEDVVAAEVVADDGARQAVTLVDTDRGRFCAPEINLGNGTALSAPVDVPVCLPTAPIAVQTPDYFNYVDDTCTTLTAFSRCPAPHEIAVSLEANACGGASFGAVHEIGPRLLEMYQSHDNVCSWVGELDPDPSTAHYAIGSTITQSFPWLERDTFGTGPLHGLHYVNRAGHPLMQASPTLHDQSWGECDVRRAHDGDELRCFPANATRWVGLLGPTLYGDAACTDPVADAPRDETTCAPVAAWLVLDEEDTCRQLAPVREAFSLVTPHEGAVFTRNADGTCTPHDGDGDWRKVEPIDIATLPVVTDRVE